MTEDMLKSLFHRYRRELEAYLTSRLRDPELAADLTQETFLRFAAQQDAGTLVRNGRAYLYRTATNLAVDHIRRQRRQRTDAPGQDDIATVPDDSPGQEEITLGRERIAQLRQALDDLPPRTRDIFVLNRIEGLSYAQVAARLAISESSVQKHLAKGLAHVTRRLRGTGGLQ